jgi:hypothetical protein
MTYVSPAYKSVVKTSLLKMQRLQNKVPPHTWQLSQAHTGSRFAVPFKQSRVYHDAVKLS